MTGSTRFSIEKTDSFSRSYKKLQKVSLQNFPETVAHAIELLFLDPFPQKSRNEPLPSNSQLPEEWTFHKLKIWISKGASGQIRLMYLVNKDDFIIKLLWIYSHEQFVKRPPDADLRSEILEALSN